MQRKVMSKHSWDIERVGTAGWRWFVLLQGCACALAVGACAPAVKEVARQASEAAIDEGAEELTQQDTQRELRSAATDPDVQKATELMTSQIAEGVLEALSSARSREQIGALTRQIARDAALGLTAAMTGPQVREHMLGLTHAITGAALSQAATSLQTELRPALTDMLQNDLAQALGAALRQQLQPAVGTTAHTVAYNAVMGANQGLGAVLGHPSGGVASAHRLWNSSSHWLWWAISALALIALIAIAAAIWMLARASRTRAEVSRLETATLLLATAMRERQQTEHNDEIVAIVQQALQRPAQHHRKHRLLEALRMHKR
jgi:hypothetical protein